MGLALRLLDACARGGLTVVASLSLGALACLPAAADLPTARARARTWAYARLTLRASRVCRKRTMLFVIHAALAIPLAEQTDQRLAKLEAKIDSLLNVDKVAETTVSKKQGECKSYCSLYAPGKSTGNACSAYASQCSGCDFCAGVTGTCAVYCNAVREAYPPDSNACAQRPSSCDACDFCLPAAAPSAPALPAVAVDAPVDAKDWCMQRYNNYLKDQSGPGLCCEKPNILAKCAATCPATSGGNCKPKA